jgi:4-hydroxythreonine-4-phosphate dehydrogenase
MFLVHENLRIGVATGHIPIHQVSKKITKEIILSKAKIMLKSLRNDFGISKPKIAILGLNPHAGENGVLGTEESEIINPAINELKSAKNLVIGPFPADGFFGMRLYKNYDGILAMYHDQGLIPFKTMAFEEGVNFTANLPFVRTSPDHGTAFDIAGKNIADPTSMRNALYLANDIIRSRAENSQN